MDHQIDVIHQDPFRMAITLYVRRAVSMRLEFLLDCIGNGLDLPGRIARAQEKILGKGGYFRNIKNDKIKSFFVIYGFQSKLQDVSHRSPYRWSFCIYRSTGEGTRWPIRFPRDARVRI